MRTCCRCAWQLVLALLTIGQAVVGRQDQVDHVFPQLGTGSKELQDDAVVKILEAELQAADKGGLKLARDSKFKAAALLY